MGVSEAFQYRMQLNDALIESGAGLDSREVIEAIELRFRRLPTVLEKKTAA